MQGDLRRPVSANDTPDVMHRKVVLVGPCRVEMHVVVGSGHHSAWLHGHAGCICLSLMNTYIPAPAGFVGICLLAFRIFRIFRIFLLAFRICE